VPLRPFLPEKLLSFSRRHLEKLVGLLGSLPGPLADVVEETPSVFNCFFHARGVEEGVAAEDLFSLGERASVAVTSPLAIHRGTRAGAMALGLDASNETLEMSVLPAELQQLSASEGEDVLCIYKDEFARR
jgi:hypothetical protein